MAWKKQVDSSWFKLISLDFDICSPFFTKIRWSCSSAIHPASVPSAPSWTPAMAIFQRWPVGPSGRPLRRCRSLGPPGPPSRWSSPRARCRPIPARICWNACCRVCIWYRWPLRRSLFVMDTSWLEADRIRKRATWIWNLDRNMLSLDTGYFRRVFYELPTALADWSWCQGKISALEAERYEEYIKQLQRCCTRDMESESSAYFRTRLLVLPDRHGFGFAVKSALEEVDTEYVPCRHRIKQSCLDSCRSDRINIF